MPTAAVRSTPARSPWFRVAGLADLVATPLRPSHYLALVNPLWGTHALRARVVRVTDETADARTLTLRPGRGWRGHRAGQYVRLGVTIGGRRHSRPYSISSAPDVPGGCFTVTVKAVAGGVVSQALVRDVRPGAYLTLGQAEGEFVLSVPAPARPLFVTAGSGITPVMSMLRTRALRDARPDLVHVHYAPHARDVVFGAELRAMAAARPAHRLHLVHTREGDRAAARFSAAQLDTFCPDWREREVWACGPAALLEAVERHWAEAGLAGRLHVERFQAPRAPGTAPGAGGRVRFATSRRTVDADGRTPLLQVAEAAGLAPAHGCRMGICHTCDVALRAGCARDLRTGAIVAEPGRMVSICVSAAAGDVELAL